MLPPRLLSAIALATLAACPSARSERDLLVEASLAAVAGDDRNAERLYAAALDTDEPSPEVLVRFASFRIDRNELADADDLLRRAAAMELTTADQRRLHTEQVRLAAAHVESIRNARRAGDPASDLVDALRTLALLDPDGPARAELGALAVAELRVALRCPDPDPCAFAADPARRPSPRVARDALGWLDVLDPRDGPVPEHPQRTELLDLRRDLERVVLDDRIQRSLRGNLGRTLAAEGSWDPESLRFRLPWDGPLPPGVRPDARPAVLQAVARSVVARDAITRLAARLLGHDGAAADPLPLTLADLASVEATRVALHPDGRLASVVELPEAVALQAAWMLARRLPATPEGSGDSSPPPSP